MMTSRSSWATRARRCSRLVELLAAIALDATVREQATPTGGRALTAYELAATRDLLERLERVKRARPTGEPISADATGADPAGVERAAP